MKIKQQSSYKEAGMSSFRKTEYKLTVLGSGGVGKTGEGILCFHLEPFLVF